MLTADMSSLRTENLTIRFGGHAAVNGVTVGFQPNELTVIVGPNGAGKTTWFNLVSGQLTPTEGRIFKGDREITSLSPSARAKAGIGRAFQLTNLFPHLSVLENVRLAVQARQGAGASIFLRATALTALRDEAQAVLERTHLSRVAPLPAAALPHGDQRKLEVALLIAMQPDIFMFDEPTAGMSADEAPVILDLIAGRPRDLGGFAVGEPGDHRSQAVFEKPGVGHGMAMVIEHFALRQIDRLQMRGEMRELVRRHACLNR